ncbi:MAG: carboxypeptidase-like regulatory domain-containing protein, partial [Chloroflexota bacterium]
MSTFRGLMTIAVVSLLAIFLLTASIQANQAGFTGQVRDIVTGDPIAGARIDVGDESILTDEDGRYTIHVHPGQHVVRVHASGYIGMSFVRQRVVGGQLLELEVEMIPSNPTPEEQSVIDA